VTKHGQADFELAKWVALVAMAVDHYGKIVDPGLYEITHAFGRLSFPILATIVGCRLALRPDLGRRYAMRLVPWAFLSQPVFVVAGRDWYDGNILFTLLFGVVATALLRRAREPGRWPAVLALVALTPLSYFFEFGPIGVAMIPLTAFSMSRSVSAALWLSGPLGLAANMTAGWPMLRWIDVPALASSLVVVGSVALRPRVPRLPTHVFYAFYPLHLLAMHFYDLYR
jgi:hypothetical protein